MPQMIPGEVDVFARVEHVNGGRRPKSVRSRRFEIAASGWADKAVIEVNLGYLHNAARFAPSDELRIGLTDDASPLKIHEGPYLAVVMPIGPAKGTKS